MQHASAPSAQVIHETLGLKHYLFALASGRACRYCRLSPAASLARRAVRRIRCLAARDRTEEFGWGDTQILGKAVGEASRRATAYLPRLESVWRVFENGNAYGFDMSLVVRKYLLVEVLYRKYFAYELCLQFSQENPQTSITLIADNDEYAEPYIEKLAASGVAIVSRRRCVACEAIAALLMIAFVMPVYWRWRTTEQCGEVAGLVCNISDPKMLSGYEELFSGTGISPTYVVPQEYARYFSGSEPSSRVIFLGLTRSGYDELKETIWRMLCVIAVNFRALSRLGPHTLKLVNKIIHARIGLPDGYGYSLLACEHHDLVKTIRNELIRKRRSRTVLFSYSSLYVLRYHADEFYENYDFVFSPGKHYDDTLEENEGRCVAFPAGTYAIHKHGLSPDKTAVGRRIGSLREFVGDDRVVTILCPGVCKPTYHSEIRLMETARALANLDGIKVLVRQKPFVPENRYAGFYEMHARGSPSILVTGTEYELFDFLPITHLFVTSYSTSACELAACGANVLFVDYLRQDERFMFWQPDIVGTLLVDEAGALGRILALLRRDPDLWPRYEVDRARFANYIAYRCDSYDAYRANVQRMLGEIGVIPAASGVPA